MKTLAKLFLLHLFVLTLAPWASAQANVKDADKKGKSYQVTYYDTWEGPELYVKEKGAYVPLVTAVYSCSQQYKYTKNVIELFEMRVDSEGEEIFSPRAVIQVPSAILEPLLIIKWDAGKKTVATKIIEYSPKKFEYGSYQIVNFSSLTIGGYMGKKTNKILCKPNSSYLTSFRFKDKEKSPIQLYAKIDDNVKKVYGSITVHKSQKRIVYLLYPTLDKLNRVSLSSRSIVSFKPAPKT